MLALFAHDFNLLYLRQLLRVHWLTPSYDFDAATPGSVLSLELHRDAPCRDAAAGCARADSVQLVHILLAHGAPFDCANNAI